MNFYAGNYSSEISGTVEKVGINTMDGDGTSEDEIFYGDGFTAPLASEEHRAEPQVRGKEAGSVVENGHGGETELSRRSVVARTRHRGKHSRSHNSIDIVNQKAGRNLPAAILVGCGLIVLLISGLFIWQPLLLVLMVSFMCLAAWELYQAFLSRGDNFSIVPVLVGIISIFMVTYNTGIKGLFMVFGLSVVAFVVWMSLDTVVKPRAVGVGILAITWLGFLPSFAFLLYGQNHAAVNDGQWKVLLIVLTVATSDTLAYLSGVLWGKHPMAPQISPKKSWEGVIGGTAGAVIFAVLYSMFILHVSWVFGVIFGVLIAVSAICGDLVESLVKRGLGIKDMSDLLPGHGGILDRLDSLLLSIPAGWMLFTFILPLLG